MMEAVRLLDVCKAYQPKTIAVKALSNEGRYPVYGANGIIGQHTDYNHSEEEVLMGCRGSCGAVHISQSYSWINGNAMVIQPNGNYPILKKYLYYCLLAARKDSVITGTAQPQITRRSLCDFKIQVCPPEQQQHIVAKIEELFSELDNSVAALKQTKAQLSVYRQAVLKDAFDGTLSETWRSTHNLPTFEENRALLDGNNKKYKFQEDISLSTLPKGWGWISLGEAVAKVEYGSSKKSEKQGRIPVVRMGNIQNGSINWDDLVYSSDESEISKYTLHKGDVLFNRTNSPELVGKTAIFRGERNAIFAGYLIRVNQRPSISPEYLTYYLNSYTAKKYGNLVKTDGVNQSNINGKKLCSYPFPLCSEIEQNFIVNTIEQRLTVLSKIESTIDKTLRQAESLRQSILKQAFEGKLV